MSGYSGPTTWPSTLSVPADPVGQYSTNIGSKSFSFGTGAGQVPYFSPETCVGACSALNSANYANAAKEQSSVICNMAVGSQLSNVANAPQGMYCTFYTESWIPEYGTIFSAPSDGENWTIGKSFSYTNSTYADDCPSFSPKGYQGGNCGGLGGLSGEC